MEETTTATPGKKIATVKPEQSNGVLKTKILSKLTRKLEVIPNVSIGPAEAEDLLTLNANRPLTKAHVEVFAAYMSSGQWIFGGNTIKIDWDGVLRDGQHSLHAVIKSGTTQIFNIQTGLDPKSFTVMDTGRMRSAGDVLAMDGHSEYYALAAAIKSRIYWEKRGRLVTHIRYDRVTNQQVKAWTEREKDMKLMVNCLDYTTKTLKYKGKGIFLAASTWAFVYFTLSKLDRERATDFVTLLSSGENISTTRHAAIYYLRERLITFGEGYGKELRKGGSYITELKLRFVFRAWNAWIKREKIDPKRGLVIKTNTPEIEPPEKPI